MSFEKPDPKHYQSTRGGFYDLSFEDVVLKGLAGDGGLFIPQNIPSLPPSWQEQWKHKSFEELAFELMSLYISPEEIPSEDLKDIISRSYSTFRSSDVTPTVALDASQNLYLLELFCGPTFAFKDVALQFLGNLFEYFLIRRNKGREGNDRYRLVVIGATSGDTGSAAIEGLRGKHDTSIFILHPKGKVSPIQEAQMTTVLDSNVHNVAIEGSFDDCQDTVKALFADPETNSKHKLAAVNSINWARILSQITYYVHSYLTLLRTKALSAKKQVRFVVPSGNFGDMLAGWYAKQMGLPVEKLVIATNENDILDRFLKTGSYTKQAPGASSPAVKETHSPAMDILVSSNFERLLWFFASQYYGKGSDFERRAVAATVLTHWLDELKSKGGFTVESGILDIARANFESERVSNDETIATIRNVYKAYNTPDPNAPVAQGTRGETGGYILDPHSAVGVTASLRYLHGSPKSTSTVVSLCTAHPAKFSSAVNLALQGQKGYSFQQVTPPELSGLEQKEKRVINLQPTAADDLLGAVKGLIDEKTFS